MKKNTEYITQHLINCYPYFRSSFSFLGPINFQPDKTVPIPEAIAKIVTNQMLFNKAALNIYERIFQRKLQLGLSFSTQLTLADLVSCGLSERKAKTINQFGTNYDSSPSQFEKWRKLDYKELVSEVSKLWGLSYWSADMLAIFYFGHIDVFPEQDSTLKKAINYIEKYLEDTKVFDPLKAKPFRTYLSLHLWRCIDNNIFDLTPNCE